MVELHQTTMLNKRLRFTDIPKYRSVSKHSNKPEREMPTQARDIFNSVLILTI